MIRFVPCLALLVATAVTASARGEVLVTLKLQTVNPVTQLPIDTVQVGENFLLQAIVQDVRDPEPEFGGVFSAGADITFDPLAAPVGDVVFDDFFSFIRTATILPGFLQNVFGATSEGTPPGQSEQLLFSVTFQAQLLGQMQFVPEFPEDPFSDILLYRDSPIPLIEEEVSMLGTSIAIVPEPSSVLSFATAVMSLGAYVYRRRRWKEQGFAARC